jgi:hypothetical protein
VLTVWRRYGGDPLGVAVRGILEDEFKHEDVLVTGVAERRINPGKVRNGSTTASSRSSGR